MKIKGGARAPPFIFWAGGHAPARARQQAIERQSCPILHRIGEPNVPTLACLPDASPQIYRPVTGGLTSARFFLANASFSWRTDK